MDGVDIVHDDCASLAIAARHLATVHVVRWAPTELSGGKWSIGERVLTSHTDDFDAFLASLP
jgi:hypothetical protein